MIRAGFMLPQKLDFDFQGDEFATGILTSDGTNPADAATVTIGAKTYRFKNTLATANDIKIGAAVAASVTLTSDATAPADGATVVIGGQTYTFKDTLSVSPTAYEVLVGISAAIALDNLKAAVNAGAGEGTLYGTGTVANTQVSATTNTDTTQLFVAVTAGAAGNSIASTETSTHLAFGTATLIGGINADIITLTNLKKAINAEGTEGTHYGTGTTENADVDASALSAQTLPLVAHAKGEAGDLLATTSTSSHLTFSAATLTGGAGVLVIAQEVGGEGGRCEKLIVAADDITGGGATFGLELADSDGLVYYSLATQDENDTDINTLGVMVAPNDVMTITLSELPTDECHIEVAFR